MPVTILLLCFVLTAAATDVAWHKVYNWTTYSGIVAAFAISAGGTALAAAGWSDEGSLRHDLGWIPLTESLLGFAACGLLMLVCFVMFRIGGGDVKLLAMLGAFMGPEQGITAMLWTFVLGGCLGLIVLIWRVGPLRLGLAVGRRLIWLLRIGRMEPLADDERAQLQPPLFLAPCALAAVVIVRFDLLNVLGYWMSG
ncbi:MAG: prepilin peptidase [Pirellulaceae bacterium]|nr:prepilin peptidase [Pirellulaceae bacterium]